MAKLETGDVEGMINKLKRIETGMRNECAEKILRAGGQVYVDEWKKEIEAHHVSKHDAQHMFEAVAITNIQLDLNGGTATVMPQGYGYRDTPHALKAWAINAGAGYIKKKDPFVKRAEKAAQPKANAAMQAALDDFIEKG